jgi:hypothetical protein
MRDTDRPFTLVGQITYWDSHVRLLRIADVDVTLEPHVSSDGVAVFLAALIEERRRIEEEARRQRDELAHYAASHHARRARGFHRPQARSAALGRRDQCADRTPAPGRRSQPV